MKKDTKIDIRCSTEDKEMIQIAALSIDETVSEFVLQPAKQKAKKLLLKTSAK